MDESLCHTVRVMYFGSLKGSKSSVFQTVKSSAEERKSIHVAFPRQRSVLFLIVVALVGMNCILLQLLQCNMDCVRSFVSSA